jgi:hypothetical protein
MRQALKMQFLVLLALLLMLASCQNPSRPLPLDALADWPSTDAWAIAAYPSLGRRDALRVDGDAASGGRSSRRACCAEHPLRDCGRQCPEKGCPASKRVTSEILPHRQGAKDRLQSIQDR